MRKFIGLIIPLLLIFFSACKTSQNNSSSTDTQSLFTIDSLVVYPEEFVYAYQKSNKNKGEIEPVEDYLDLYVDFKLKVLAAKAEGIDSTESYLNELQGYLEEIKKPYLTAEKVNQELVEEAYNRLQKEISASHILIMLDKEASANDTLKAYQKLQDIKKAFDAGTSFEALAIEHSEDPSVRSNKGSLGWFTAFQMVYPFESAAFETEIGEISPIIRTQFGYHLIKVNDKRETLGRIKIAHIMKRFPPQATKQDSTNTELAIREVYNKLNAGDNWFILATEESDDLNTKDKGGSLPWFGAGNLPSGLETVAFELEEQGQISQPVKSPFGWHILKLENKRGVGSLESMKESLSRRVQRDQRSELKDAAVIKKLKAENNFSKNKASYELLKEKENLKIENFSKRELKENLFSIFDQDYSLENFLSNYNAENSLAQELEDFERDMLIQFEENNLESKYPEYRLLRQEYKDGLLLFEIMNKKVWSKIGQDTVQMKEFYEKHADQYVTDRKLKVAKIIFSDTAAIKKFKQPIKGQYFPLTQEFEYETAQKVKEKISLNGDSTETIFMSISLPKSINSKDSLSVLTELNQSFSNMEVVNLIYSSENKIYLQLLSEANKLLARNNQNITAASEELIEVDKNSKWINKKEGSYSTSMTKNGAIEFNYVLKSYPPKLKTFKEARPSLIEDYQEQIEADWLKSLHDKYNVSINQDVLNQIKKEIEE